MSVRIAIVGSGYVGLVSGACFAELGHDVVCVDRNVPKIVGMQQGVMPIYEPGLDDLVRRNAEKGRLRFSADTGASVSDRDAIFIAVGTPTDQKDGSAELTYVFEAAREIAGAISGHTVIIVKSTVPVGTNSRVAQVISSHLSANATFSMASNPEFLREGAALNDFMFPDRIVIGCDQFEAEMVMRRIYAPLIAANVPIVITDSTTAELIKYAANAFLAVKVSFINEVSDLCEALGADIRDVANGIGLDRRIGGAFLRPGPGWGGSCFPKDTRALLATASHSSVRVSTVEAAIASNSARKSSMAQRVVQSCGGRVDGKNICVFGLTFKGQTDDMRESPALEIIKDLVNLGANVTAFDPSKPEAASQLLPQIRHAYSPQHAVAGSDLLLILTDWGVFTTYDMSELASLMRDPVMLDLRNLFDKNAILAGGFRKYQGLGH